MTGSSVTTIPAPRDRLVLFSSRDPIRRCPGRIATPAPNQPAAANRRVAFLGFFILQWPAVAEPARSAAVRPARQPHSNRIVSRSSPTGRTNGVFRWRQLLWYFGYLGGLALYAFVVRRVDSDGRFIIASLVLAAAYLILVPYLTIRRVHTKFARFIRCPHCGDWFGQDASGAYFAPESQVPRRHSDWAMLQVRSTDTFRFMRTPPNQPAAPNAGIASQLTIEHHWPGVGEPERSAILVARICPLP